MKSPFPGMDPYLEDQGRWPDFHASMITYCRDALSERLQDDYVAQMEASSQSSGGVATLEACCNSFRLGSRRGERYLGRNPPASRRAPRHGDRGAVADQQGFERASRIPGQAPAAPRRAGQPGRDRSSHRGAPAADGPLSSSCALLHVRRAPSKPESADVYAWSLDSSLPTIPIPLEAPDPDTLLDLAEIFALAYRRGRYARLINYSKSLSLPLHPQDKEWVEKVAASAAEAQSPISVHLFT